MSSIGSGGPNSWHALFIQAAGKGDEPRVRELLEEGPPRGDVFRDALRIALQRAAGRGHESLTRLLLEEGAEVNAALEGEVPPLYRAAELGRDRIVKVLLEYGATTGIKDKTKRTAIFPAAQRNHRIPLSLLLEAGADVNAKDEDGQNLMLCLASEKSDKALKWGSEIIQILLQTDLNLEERDKDGRTALLWAAATGKETLAKLLLSGRIRNNADIDATNNRGKTALHLAVESKSNRLALVKVLLEHGANVHAQSDGGWTALHNAAEKGYDDVASLLLQWKADVNATTSNGMTPLHWSARNGHMNAVNVLLQQHDIRRDRKDSVEETPMLGAAQNGHIDIVRLLSPADDGAHLSTTAQAACRGFQATVVDFGMEHRTMNHKKYSVFDLLYGWEEQKQKPTVTTLVRNIPAKPAFRWIHLPANNMTWVETLITKHFIENSASDVDGFKALEKILGQQHRGPTVHSHFMRPLCQRMQPTGKNVPSSEPESVSEQSNIDSEILIPTIVLPEQENVPLRDLKPSVNVSDKKSTPKNPTNVEKKSKNADKNPAGGPSRRTSESLRVRSTPPKKRGEKQMTRSKTPIGKKPGRKGNVVLFMPYLHYETHQKRKMMSDAIKRATAVPDRKCDPDSGFTCDEMLIQAYLQSTHNLQIRRTLDQFYYHAISTEGRDTDQVVYRYTRDRGKEKKVFMVDQLWLWILGNDLIITSFPQRWQQPKNDPLNVLDGIIEDMNSKTRPPVKSVYDLAVLITGRCSGVFDRHRLRNGDYQFLDMFESSIGEVVCHLSDLRKVRGVLTYRQTNKETELFKKFNDASVAAAQWLAIQRQRGKSLFLDASSSESDITKDPTFVDTLLDIGEETALLAETKDIRDELNMISMVFDHQLSVLDDLSHALLEELNWYHDQQKPLDIKKRFREQQKVIEVHLKDVERMDKQAEGIYTSVR